MNDSDAQTPEPAPGRRRVLAWLTGALGALVGGAALAGPLGIALDPLLRRRRSARAVDEEAAWTAVASAARFPAGGDPVQVVLAEDRRDAWLARPNTPIGPVFVQRLGEDEFRVFSGVCPHLGCSVKFLDEAGRYRCPCHRSAFQVDGSLVARPGGEPNPAPRGLDPLEWRVRGGRLEVRWVRYETGTEERIPIVRS
ncbi:MAG: ubiquinol-cytochrome c reductase iron-sulfur subunit [Myxococcota bacterium]